MELSLLWSYLNLLYIYYSYSADGRADDITTYSVRLYNK
jgi:hypothetical protein